MRNWRTSTGGILTFLGLLISAAATLFDGNQATTLDVGSLVVNAQQIGLITAATGALLHGILSRDYNVTSEGKKVPKSKE